LLRRGRKKIKGRGAATRKKERVGGVPKLVRNPCDIEDVRYHENRVSKGATDFVSRPDAIRDDSTGKRERRDEADTRAQKVGRAVFGLKPKRMREKPNNSVSKSVKKTALCGRQREEIVGQKVGRRSYSYQGNRERLVSPWLKIPRGSRQRRGKGDR